MNLLFNNLILRWHNQIGVNMKEFADKLAKKTKPNVFERKALEILGTFKDRRSVFETNTSHEVPFGYAEGMPLLLFIVSNHLFENAEKRVGELVARMHTQLFKERLYKHEMGRIMTPIAFIDIAKELRMSRQTISENVTALMKKFPNDFIAIEGGSRHNKRQMYFWVSDDFKQWCPKNPDESIADVIPGREQCLQN